MQSGLPPKPSALSVPTIWSQGCQHCPEERSGVSCQEKVSEPRGPVAGSGGWAGQRGGSGESEPHPGRCLRLPNPRVTPVQPSSPPRIPETVNPRSPLQTRRHCRGPSSALVRFVLPRRRSYFRNSRRITAHAQPAASALASTILASAERMRTPVFNVLALAHLVLRFTLRSGSSISAATPTPEHCPLQNPSLLTFPAVVLPMKVKNSMKVKNLVYFCSGPWLSLYL